MAAPQDILGSQPRCHAQVPEGDFIITLEKSGDRDWGT